ncbi:MAG TPA: hypothetical protein VGO45_05625 [Bacteroidia bacterium]|jgi:hypothetical protein|nr:hypothetical protein [Bacteroidia bacterium]
MKINGLILILLFQTCLVFSQNPGKKESLKNPEPKTFLKPTSFDSTQTLSEQYTPANENQFIGLELFLPPPINAEAGPILFSKSGRGIDKGNRRFKVIDILKASAVEQLKQKNLTCVCGYRYKDPGNLKWKEMVVFAVFVLRDEEGKDVPGQSPVYWVVCESKEQPYSNSNLCAFVAQPFLEKQKQLFENQPVVLLSGKTKWTCVKVTLTKGKDSNSSDSCYQVSCLLKNGVDAQMQVLAPTEKSGRTIMTEKQYDWLNNFNRNEQAEWQKAENEKKEKHKAMCISRFGQQKGVLVDEEKVEAGMTSEMCLVAWGKPWDVTKALSAAGIKETWSYSWKYKLHFEKGILVRIEH